MSDARKKSGKRGRFPLALGWYFMPGMSGLQIARNAPV